MGKSNFYVQYFGKGRTIAAGLGLLGFLSLALPARASHVFTVTMQATGDLKADYLAFGMDDAATQGYDDNLDEPAPPAAPSGDTAAFLINGDIARLGKDYRPVEDSEVWTLAVTLAAGHAATLSWTLPNDGYLDDKTLEFHDGQTVVDMKAQSSVNITRSGWYAIVYRAPQITNTAPVARDDCAGMWETEDSVDISVLDNDEDIDGDTLTVTQVTDPPNGTASVAGNIVHYTPDAGFSGTDTFSYTISDGNGGTDTAAVTVTVFSGHVVARRTHPAFAIPGSEFTVSLIVQHDGSLHSLSIQEILPISDEQPPNPWLYVADSFSGPTRGAAVSQNGSTLIIDFGADVPASPFTVSYKLSVPQTDVNQKTFSGSLIYTLTAEADQGYPEHTAEIPDTTVVPGILYHSADYNQNWKIDFDELLRVIGYYNAGGYHTDANNGLDDFAPGSGAVTGQYHSADYHGAGGVGSAPDGVMQIDELLRVIGYFNAGAYHVDSGNGLDGYAPGPEVR